MDLKLRSEHFCGATVDIRIHQPMQETQVRSLIQEDPTCHEQLSLCAATKSPGAATPEAWKPWSQGSTVRNHRMSPQQLEKPLLATAKENPAQSSEDPAQPKISA